MNQQVLVVIPKVPERNDAAEIGEFRRNEEGHQAVLSLGEKGICITLPGKIGKDLSIAHDAISGASRGNVLRRRSVRGFVGGGAMFGLVGWGVLNGMTLFKSGSFGNYADSGAMSRLLVLVPVFLGVGALIGLIWSAKRANREHGLVEFKLLMPSGETLLALRVEPASADECQRVLLNSGIHVDQINSEEESALLQSERLKQEASGDSTSPPAGLPFNWGAGLLAPLWLLAHGRIGAGIGLIVLNLVFSRLFALMGPVGWIIDFMIGCTILIFVGSNANRIAWKNKKYSSIEEMRRRQKPWLIAGVIISAVVALSIGILVLSMRAA
jgi:hypothetical protein